MFDKPSGAAGFLCGMIFCSLVSFLLIMYPREGKSYQLRLFDGNGEIIRSWGSVRDVYSREGCLYFNGGTRVSGTWILEKN
jgi:hypothetical protein